MRICHIPYLQITDCIGFVADLKKKKWFTDLIQIADLLKAAVKHIDFYCFFQFKFDNSLKFFYYYIENYKHIGWK